MRSRSQDQAPDDGVLLRWKGRTRLHASQEIV